MIYSFLPTSDCLLFLCFFFVFFVFVCQSDRPQLYNYRNRLSTQKRTFFTVSLYHYLRAPIPTLRPSQFIISFTLGDGSFGQDMIRSVEINQKFSTLGYAIRFEHGHKPKGIKTKNRLHVRLYSAFKCGFHTA